MNVGHMLFFTGFVFMISGLVFGIPMPVQPMKSIAAVAIAEGMDQDTIIAAGICAGLVMLILTATGLINLLSRVIPKSVIRGIQLAVGLKLLIKGAEMIIGTGIWFSTDSIITGIVCAAIIMSSMKLKRMPSALVIFLIGIGLIFINNPQLASRFTPGWELPYLHIPSMENFRVGFWQGTVPQIPLTILNSVIAVCALSVDLFPKRPLSPRKTAYSVGLINLIIVPFGAMPMCHGSGGLAAQYRFGARTGGSVVLLGMAYMIMAVFFGNSLLLMIEAFPLSVLGVLLVFSGLELAVVCRDQTRKIDFFVAALTAGISIASNVAFGFLAGWIAAIYLNKISFGEK